LIDQKNGQGGNLLHTLRNSRSDSARDIVQYLCDRHPDFLLMTDDFGQIPLNAGHNFNLEIIKIMCQKEQTIISHVCHRDNTRYDGKLPLHHIVNTLYGPLSDEGNRFRYTLNLYPAAAGIRDAEGNSPYDIAIQRGISFYFRRLLLNADHTTESKIWRDLNYAARKEAMFLAYLTEH
jgi:hypothetical protein